MEKSKTDGKTSFLSFPIILSTVTLGVVLAAISAVKNAVFERVL